MKKVILSLVAVMAFGFANAQDKKMSLGVKGGLNISTLTGGGSLGASSKIGGNLGAFAEFGISDKFAVQPEVLFSMQGANYGDVNFSLNYINIPVMAKYYFTESIALEVGPQFGLLMSTDPSESKDGLKSSDLGLNIGASYNITDKLVANFRYNYGFSDLNKESVTGFEVRNAVMQASIGYKFM